MRPASSSILALLLVATGFVSPLAAADPSYVVAFITSPQDDASVVVNQAVSFVSGAYAQSCQIAQYDWDFGDGASAATRDAEHTYASVGTYTISHEVTGCAHRHTVFQTLHVILPPPTASLDVTVSGAGVTLDASASSSTSGTVNGYQFTLDGVQSPLQSGPTLTLTVAQHGSHVAGVVVFDDAGGQSAPASVSFDTVATLARIELDGPATIVAGATASYATTGFDDLNDEMALLVESVDFVAPTTAGSAVVSYEEQGVTGTLVVEVVAGDLATITLAGPSTVQVATSAAFTATGADEFGNVVPLVYPIVTFTAPSIAGPRTVCHSEQGIVGCLDVLVVPGPVVRVFVTGPARLAVDESGVFDVAGIDAYGNAVTLAVSSFVWTAPSFVGLSEVCYVESGVEGCATVEVVLVRVARVALVPSATDVNIGRPVALTFLAYDANDQIVDAGAPQCVTNRGVLDAQLVFRSSSAGVAIVTCSIQGLSASSTIRIVRDLVVTLEVDDNVSLALLGASGVNITARFLDGGAVAGGSAVVTFEQFAGPVLVHLQSMTVTLDADGKARLEMPALARLPGDHRATATVVRGGNSGSDSETYAVNLPQ